MYFSSFQTGKRFNTSYSRIAFEADLPRIEAPDLGGTCDRTTGEGCTLVPRTDDGAPADFYPFYTKGFLGRGCFWSIGDDIPGFTRNDFGKNAQYGTLLPLTYTGLAGCPSPASTTSARPSPATPAPRTGPDPPRRAAPG